MKGNDSQKANKAPGRAKRTALFAVVVGCLVILAAILALFLIHSLGGL